MVKNGSNGSGEGNTSPSPEIAKKGKKREQNGAKRWIFVWNNYPENWEALMAPGLKGCQWLAGYEVGNLCGTPHIQGYAEFPIKVRPIGYKGMPKQIHWGDERGRPCKADRAANVAYVTKDHVKAGGNLMWPRPLPDIELYGWQLDAKEMFESEPDKRSIFWYWSDEGARGKSTMCRWLVRHGALITAGSAADMKFLVAQFYKKNGVFPECIVLNVPRSKKEYISYTGIEEIKDGVFASTKYECEPMEMPYVHFFVFANFPPDMKDKDMSRDRFRVRCVDKPPEPYAFGANPYGF